METLPFDSRSGGLSKLKLQRMVTVFETIGSVKNQSTPGPQTSAKLAEQIATVHTSLQEKNSYWSILGRELGLYPYKSNWPRFSNLFNYRQLSLLANWALEPVEEYPLSFLASSGILGWMAKLTSKLP